MVETLWELPMPATALISGPIFKPLRKRECELSFAFEGIPCDQRISLILEGVETYTCTYLTACTAEMFETAYGKLVNLGDTPELSEIRERLRHAGRQQLRNLRICFDDGPCFDFVCLGFRVANTTAVQDSQ